MQNIAIYSFKFQSKDSAWIVNTRTQEQLVLSISDSITVSTIVFSTTNWLRENSDAFGNLRIRYWPSFWMQTDELVHTTWILMAHRNIFLREMQRCYPRGFYWSGSKGCFALGWTVVFVFGRLFTFVLLKGQIIQVMMCENIRACQIKVSVEVWDVTKHPFLSVRIMLYWIINGVVTLVSLVDTVETTLEVKQSYLCYIFMELYAFYHIIYSWNNKWNFTNKSS